MVRAVQSLKGGSGTASGCLVEQLGMLGDSGDTGMVRQASFKSSFPMSHLWLTILGSMYRPSILKCGGTV